MADRVSLSAERHNIHEAIELAVAHDLGIEVMAFAYPEVLDGDWRKFRDEYQELLAPIRGDITLHGPFMDMVSGSPDPRVNDVCIRRYSHAIRIAHDLGARNLVFHANFIGTLHNAFYREGWHERNVEFWKPLAEYAQTHNVTIALENMWEFDPTIIGDLIRAVDHPYLKTCVDVGHAHLFTNSEFSFNDWLQVMHPHIVEYHMNNNNGIIDEHHGFDWEHGTLNYNELLPNLRAAAPDATMVLEMYKVEEMRDSLYYFQLATATS
jgi:sugar phosphate isomerase/epimerase